MCIRDRDKTEASSADLAAALQQGVEAAYKAVMKPTEGTKMCIRDRPDRDE